MKTELVKLARITRPLALLFTILLVASCATTEKAPNLLVTPSTFKALPGWGQDNLSTFVKAFNRSCARIQKLSPAKAFSSIEESGNNAHWQSVCSQFKTVNADDPIALKHFFETHFKPYQVANNSDSKGLFTGYFEASLNGSRTPKAPYLTPLHQRPG